MRVASHELGAQPDQAQQLLDAETFRYDMDDSLGGPVQQAIFAGILQYLASPDQLDTILQGIEDARTQ